VELFIRIKDGEPFQHPIFGDNFRQAFPDVDVNNLPAGYMRFIRKEPPQLGPYRKNLRAKYVVMGEYCTDEFVWDEMTDEERKALQEAVKAEWASNNGFASWWFDELTCRFMPPTPMPDPTKPYVWRESDQTWVLIPPQPEPSVEGWEFDVESEAWRKV